MRKVEGFQVLFLNPRFRIHGFRRLPGAVH